MLKTSLNYNFDDDSDGADMQALGLHSVAETIDIQQNLSLFVEVMDSLGSDDAVKQSDILKEMYVGQLNGMQEKIMLLITKFQDDGEAVKALLELSDWMEAVLAQYHRRSGASSPANPANKRASMTKEQLSLALEGHLDGEQRKHQQHSDSDSDVSDSASDFSDDREDEEALRRITSRGKDKGKRKVVMPDIMDDITSVFNNNNNEENAQPKPQEPVFRSGYKRPEAPGECPICCDDAPAEDLFIFDTCEHQYCRECLKGYFANLVEERKVLNITCPHPGCKTLVEYHQVQTVVTDEMFQKYEEATFMAALNTDPSVKWCPRPGCGNAIIGDPENPRCECTDPNCRYEFCFLCSEPWHQNATCEQYQEWKLENGLIDTKFSTWAKKNTKKCPQCKTMIEKIAGCNHMTCSSCKFEFCWLCGGKYSSSHFDVFNVLGCPGMQSGTKQFGVARRMGMRALIGTGLVLGGILGTALAIPAAVVAGPIYGGYKLHQRRKRSSRRRRYEWH